MKEGDLKISTIFIDAPNASQETARQCGGDVVAQLLCRPFDACCVGKVMVIGKLARQKVRQLVMECGWDH